MEHLELTNFDALQIRRNDFQYKHTRLSVEEICTNIRSLFDQHLSIYIATDEDREEIFDQLAIGLKTPNIVCWKDVEAIYPKDIPFAWIGPLEQLICTRARRFVGTELSTFTSYIHRLRGYSQAVDQNLYFHNQSYSNDVNSVTEQQLRGREYLIENPLFWLEC